MTLISLINLVKLQKLTSNEHQHTQQDYGRNI